MKLSKTFIGILASASILSFAIAPVVSATQTAQASANFDIPVGTVTKNSGIIYVRDHHHGPVTHLYNFQGNDPQISAVRSVEDYTYWYTDEYKTAPNENGVICNYWRVSTNEWVLDSDVVN